MLLPIHIIAGGLALILGAVALSVKKGGGIHRRLGRLFVYAMVVMGVSAASLGNVAGGLIAVYFVVTALMTVRPVSPWTRRINIATLAFIALLALATIVTGAEKLNNPGLSPGGVPWRTIGAMSMFLATVMILAAIGDLRVIRAGALHGAPRLKRHLWRMCFALFIAAGSFFSIRERVAKILPDPFTSGPMRMAPIVLIFVVMFYWLRKLRGRKLPPVILRSDRPAA